MNRLLLSRPIFAAVALMIAAFAIGAGTQVQAQAQPHFNHTTIYVVDLQKSADFYKRVMQLPEIPEPFHDGRHVWIRIGDHAQLHIVAGAKEDIPHDVNIHLAFSVPSLDAFLHHLDEAHVHYGDMARTSTAPQLRPDGVHQVYFQDPDGYWIEVNDDKF